MKLSDKYVREEHFFLEVEISTIYGPEWDGQMDAQTASFCDVIPPSFMYS